MGRFCLALAAKSRKARNLAQNANCVVCTEHANEAVIVEGTAEIADLSCAAEVPAHLRAQVQIRHEGNGAGHSVDEEPVFAVRPRLAFGLWEKHFVGKSTRWKFD